MFTLRQPVNSFVQTTKNVLLSPVNFFRSVTWAYVPLTDSIAYIFICSAVGSAINYVIWTLTFGSIIKSYQNQSSGMISNLSDMYAKYGITPPPQTPQAAAPLTSNLFGSLQLIGIFVFPVFYIIGLFIGSLITFYVAKIIFKATGSVKTVFNALSAVSATQLLSWIPFINMIAGIYSIVLVIIAIRESLYMTTGKTIITIIIAAIVEIILISLVISSILINFGIINPDLINNLIKTPVL